MTNFDAEYTFSVFHPAWMPDWRQFYFILYSVTFNLAIIKPFIFTGKMLKLASLQ